MYRNLNRKVLFQTLDSHRKGTFEGNLRGGMKTLRKPQGDSGSPNSPHEDLHELKVSKIARRSLFGISDPKLLERPRLFTMLDGTTGLNRPLHIKNDGFEHLEVAHATLLAVSMSAIRSLLPLQGFFPLLFQKFFGHPGVDVIPGERFREVTRPCSVMIHIYAARLDSLSPSSAIKLITPPIKTAPFLVGLHQQAAQRSVTPSPKPFQ
jgi:hypothetical protein